MPFDIGDFPDSHSGEAPLARSRRIVSGWLLTICGMMLVMIVLGGATRLTGSGLSIMEWAPLSGVIPPLTHAEWDRLFTLYKQIPQYQLVNDGIDLDGFKQLFWLEWVHRAWGRLMGLAFFVPLVWFGATGRLERRLLPRLGLFFVLGGLQGAVGWFMVASGFEPASTSVSPYRLVIHLALALALYGAVLWTALSLRPPRRLFGVPAAVLRLPRRLTAITLVSASLTILAGGFVAGNHAGLDYNTFPLMDGKIVPTGYARLQPLLRNLTENIAAVQFDHRLLATVTGTLALATAAAGLLCRLPGAVLAPLLAIGGIAVIQYALGVLTLINVVPVGLAVAHQAGAVLLLTATIVGLHALLRGVLPTPGRVVLS